MKSKYAGLLMIMAVVAPTLVFGQDVSLLNQYEIPSYKYHSLVINSPNLLDYSVSKEESRKKTQLTSSLIMDEFLVAQKPKDIRKLVGRIALVYQRESEQGPRDLDSTAWRAELTASFAAFRHYYLANERGFFLHGAGQAVMKWMPTDSNSVFANVYMLPVGIGWGRVIGVRNVVQAYTISDELGSNLSAADVHALAEVIEQWENGYFEAENRDDAEVEFYSRIAAITGKPGQAMKVRQILLSPVYKTAQRFTGWQAKLSINNMYISLGDLKSGAQAFDYAAALEASIEYGLPISFDKQLSAFMTYSTPITDFGDPTLNLGATLSIDHNYHWSSMIGFTYKKLMPDIGNDLANTAFRIETDYVIMNRLSLLASLSMQSEEFFDLQDVLGVVFPIPSLYTNKRESTQFGVGFKWYLL